MSQLLPYDPVSHKINKFLQNFWRSDALDFMRDDQVLDLKIDLSQDQNNYFVKVDIPGVNKEDIKIDIDGNFVTISAESKRQKEEKRGEMVLYRERYHGQFYRSFRLDVDVDESKSLANYNNGVLELILPKKINSHSKRLMIS